MNCPYLAKLSNLEAVFCHLTLSPKSVKLDYTSLAIDQKNALPAVSLQLRETSLTLPLDTPVAILAGNPLMPGTKSVRKAGTFRPF